MMRKEPLDEQIDQFRKKIEEIVPLSSQTESSQQELVTSVSAMLEELQVASEELRQQNQELYQAQMLVLQESHRYQSLFEAAPDAYLVTDPYGIIKQANRAASELLNVPQPRLIGKPVAAFLRGDGLKEMLNRLHLLVLERGRSGWETQLHPRNQDAVEVLISAALQTDENDPRGQVLWLVRDQTQARHMERQVHEARERFRIIFEAAQIGILFLDLQGRYLESNSTFQNIFQVTADELAQATYPDPLLITNRIKESQQFAELAAGQLDRYENEHTAWRKDGKVVWVRVIMSLLRGVNGQPRYALGFCEDTSLLHEQEREIIQLERYLEESDEKERASLARDLHDGPLQYQINLLFEIQQLAASIEDPELLQQLEKIREDARQVVSMLRTTSGLLRSPILRTFGLNRAILAYINLKQTSTQTNIFADLTLADEDLPSRVQQGVYRIFQNGLNNALHHANAGQVVVRLFRQDSSIVLEIEDNGQGFAVPKRWADLVQDEHYGLVGSAERAVGLGGNLQIHSNPDEGTLLRVTIPIEENQQRKSRLTDLGPEINQF